MNVNEERLNRVHPGDGGCWFCFTAQNDVPGGWLYSSQWDANLHRRCLDRELAKREPSYESLVMAREFGIT